MLPTVTVSQTTPLICQVGRESALAVAGVPVGGAVSATASGAATPARAISDPIARLDAPACRRPSAECRFSPATPIMDELLNQSTACQSAQHGQPDPRI